jgi:hypothetical protein
MRASTLQLSATASYPDRACLLFGVFLIDHTLISDLFESVVIAVFVVGGIDAKKQIFKSPADSTPLLSGNIS